MNRLILISFPHVEGPTSVEQPATGRLDRHADLGPRQTRLEEERLLFDRTRGTATTPVVLRLGMVYGRGILMIEAARWLARHRLLAVWREPTIMQMLATEDYLRATEAAIVKDGVQGIYHVGDEQPVTLQHFLDEACRVWGCARPMRVPVWLVYLSAALCEAGAFVLRNARAVHARLHPPRPRVALGRYAPRPRGARAGAPVPDVRQRIVDSIEPETVRNLAIPPNLAIHRTSRSLRTSCIRQRL